MTDILNYKKNIELASENDWKLRDCCGNNIWVLLHHCGIKIGDNSIIGAGSLVLKDVKEALYFIKNYSYENRINWI